MDTLLEMRKLNDEESTTTQTCIRCESDNIEKKTAEKTIEVRKDKITVTSEYWQCNNCNEEWVDPEDEDSLEKAYETYRNKYHMLKPERIKELRKQYGLTQRELAGIFEWGLSTITRYENGHLPSKSHYDLLELLENEERFYNFVKNKQGLRDKERYLSLIASKIKVPSVELLLEPFLDFSASDLTGFTKPSIDKITNAILFFCKDEGVLITKLNKLLFYTDFKYFKEYTSSLTGLRYRHLKYGPVPEQYYNILNALVNNKKLQVEEVLVGEHIGVLYKSSEPPDITVFTDEELSVLLKIKKEFKDYGSEEISKCSYKEKAWFETEENGFISYLHADELSV